MVNEQWDVGLLLYIIRLTQRKVGLNPWLSKELSFFASSFVCFVSFHQSFKIFLHIHPSRLENSALLLSTKGNRSSNRCLSLISNQSRDTSINTQFQCKDAGKSLCINLPISPSHRQHIPQWHPAVSQRTSNPNPDHSYLSLLFPFPFPLLLLLSYMPNPNPKHNKSKFRSTDFLALARLRRRIRILISGKRRGMPEGMGRVVGK